MCILVDKPKTKERKGKEKNIHKNKKTKKKPLKILNFIYRNKYKT